MAEELVDSYSEANQDAEIDLWDHHPSDSEHISAIGQSFTCGSTLKITSVKFYLTKDASPTGLGHAVLYAHSGTYGTSSVPTGAALATSDDFDVSDLAYNLALITFNFTGEEQYEMQADTKYCIVFENPASGTINISSHTSTGVDSSSPTHDGNALNYLDGGWAALSTNDIPFYVYGEAAGGVEHTHFSTDTLAMSDSLAVAATYNVALADTLAMNDSLAALKVLLHSASDTLAINDVLAAVMQFNVALDDKLNMSDALAAAATYNVALADKLNISDSLAFAATYAVALADTMNMSDAMTAGWKFYVSLADTMKMSDSMDYETFVSVVRKIRRGHIYGLKPARVVNVGRVGV